MNKKEKESTTKTDNTILPEPDYSLAYDGFQLIKDTEINGWIYGAITKYICKEGCESGDGYIQSPEGIRAGLVWEVGNFKTETIMEPSKGRWGVYSIAFPRKIFSQEDLIFCFKSILPELKEIYKKINLEGRTLLAETAK